MKLARFLSFAMGELNLSREYALHEIDEAEVWDMAKATGERMTGKRGGWGGNGCRIAEILGDLMKERKAKSCS